MIEIKNDFEYLANWLIRLWYLVCGLRRIEYVLTWMDKGVSKDIRSIEFVDSQTTDSTIGMTLEAWARSTVRRENIYLHYEIEWRWEAK